MSQYDESIQTGRTEDVEWEPADTGPTGGGTESGRERTRRDAGGDPYVRPVEQKSVAGAAVLSAMPGLGQIYAGYYQRGFIHIAVVAGLILLLNQSELYELTPFFGIFLPFYWIYNIIDAARCAQIVNRLARGASPREVGAELPMPGQAGGVFTGGLLIALGVLLLLVTRFDMDLRWLREWWPLILVVIGVRLVMKGRRSAV